MFKSKIKIWFILIIITSIISSIPLIFNYIQEKKQKENEKLFSINIADFLDENLFYKTNHFILSNNNIEKNEDVIITSQNDEATNIEKNNYEFFKDALYSPIVLFTNNSLDKNSGFYKYDEVYTYDLKKLLLAIEEDKLWIDLKIQDVIPNKYNKVNIYFPNKENPYYKNVIDLMILTLNDFKEPNKEELNILYNRTLNILNKCDSYSNFNEFKPNNKVLILGVESNISDNYKSFSNNLIYKGFKQIVLDKTICVKYNLLINKEKLTYIKEILKNDIRFLEGIAFRNIFMEYSVKDSVYFNKSSDILNIKENLLLNTSYTDIILNSEVTSLDMEQSNITSVNKDNEKTELTNIDNEQSELTNIDNEQSELTNINNEQSEVTNIDNEQSEVTNIDNEQSEVTNIDNEQSEVTKETINESEEKDNNSNKTTGQITFGFLMIIFLLIITIIVFNIFTS